MPRILRFCSTRGFHADLYVASYCFEFHQCFWSHFVELILRVRVFTIYGQVLPAAYFVIVILRFQLVTDVSSSVSRRCVAGLPGTNIFIRFVYGSKESFDFRRTLCSVTVCWNHLIQLLFVGIDQCEPISFINRVFLLNPKVLSTCHVKCQKRIVLTINLRYENHHLVLRRIQAGASPVLRSLFTPLFVSTAQTIAILSIYLKI